MNGNTERSFLYNLYKIISNKKINYEYDREFLYSELYRKIINSKVTFYIYMEIRDNIRYFNCLRNTSEFLPQEESVNIVDDIHYYIINIDVTYDIFKKYILLQYLYSKNNIQNISSILYKQIIMDKIIKYHNSYNELMIKKFKNLKLNSNLKREIYSYIPSYKSMLNYRDNLYISVNIMNSYIYSYVRLNIYELLNMKCYNDIFFVKNNRLFIPIHNNDYHIKDYINMYNDGRFKIVTSKLNKFIL